MLQVARLAPKQLGESRDLVASFLNTQRAPDGGFRDRAGTSDLYYTVFGLEALIALQADPGCNAASAYLRAFGDGESLDFVHTACLARARASISAPPSPSIIERIESYRSADGGYNPTPSAAEGTLYAAFLALGAYQDLREAMPNSDRLLDFVARCKARDGGYANRPGIPAGLTTSTAAAVSLQRNLDGVPDSAVADWLIARCGTEGGFFASAATPIPDLLSTATALHALTSLQVPLTNIRERCLDFIDTLWSNRGGFVGTWADDALDCEYTYYALLALGHLSL
jgi:prenyltransferase beta subunit